jgi:hypothetical protein
MAREADPIWGNDELRLMTSLQTGDDVVDVLMAAIERQGLPEGRFARNVVVLPLSIRVIARK